MNSRPNLVFVVADQLRADALGSAGNPSAMTPNLDALAGQGVTYSNAVSSTPVCAAFRASLFTGKYTSSTGMVINELRMNPDHRCFGHVLGDAGYETSYIGKWHLWADNSNHRDPSNHFVPPGPNRLGFDGYWAAYNFWHRYYESFYFEDTDERVDVHGYEPDVQTDLAIARLEHHATRSQPFALFLSYGTVHDPWSVDNVPPEYLAMFQTTPFGLPETWSDVPDPYMDRHTEPGPWIESTKKDLPEYQRVYHAMLANLDWNVGRIVAKLDDLGLTDNTILVFTSDHGEMMGAHGRIQKLTFYEEACRVPFFLRWPERVPAGIAADACLGTPDIMPTILSLLDLSIPEDVEGIDLARSAIGSGGPEPEAAFLQGMGHTFQWRDGFEWRAARDKRFTYARYRVDGSELLFDNLSDPLQRINLISDPSCADVSERLRHFTDARMAEIQDGFEACSWYGDHWVQDRRIMRGARG